MLLFALCKMAFTLKEIANYWLFEMMNNTWEVKITRAKDGEDLNRLNKKERETSFLEEKSCSARMALTKG